MPKAPVPQRSIETRSSNRLTHPGLAIKTTQRRTSAEVQQEREAKAKAKAAQQEAKQQSIKRAANFEHAEMANEDIVDATPRPVFTPKPWPASNNHKNAHLTPIAETSDGEIFDGFDAASFAPSYPEKSVSDDDSDIESDGPPPPAKKLQVEKTGKAVMTARAKPVGGKVAEKRKKVDDDADEVVLDSEEEKPQEAKPKKVKVKVRDEIDIAMKKIAEDKIQNKYSDMVKSMPSKRAGEKLRGGPAPEAPSQIQAQANKRLKREGAIGDIKALCEGQVNTIVPSKHTGEELRGRPAPEAPSQVQAQANKKLKREGAIADIKALCKSRVNTAVSESSKCSQQNPQQNLMDDYNRYILSHILMLPFLTLDCVTLHYWTLSDSYNQQKRGSEIKAWASAVSNGNPTSRAPKSVSSHVPSLTSGASRSSAPSVLTDNVKIISRQVSDSVKVKEEPVPALSLFDDGGLSDNDEMRGEEREAAINSPPKGKKRVTSEVGPSCHCSMSI